MDYCINSRVCNYGKRAVIELLRTVINTVCINFIEAVGLEEIHEKKLKEQRRTKTMGLELSNSSVHCVVHCLRYCSMTLFMDTVHMGFRIRFPVQWDLKYLKKKK